MTKWTDPVPFQSAEEAWFWFCRSVRIRNSGMKRPIKSGLFPRPCDPDDIYLIIARQFKMGGLSKLQIKLLLRGLSTEDGNKHVFETFVKAKIITPQDADELLRTQHTSFHYAYDEARKLTQAFDRLERAFVEKGIMKGGPDYLCKGDTSSETRAVGADLEQAFRDKDVIGTKQSWTS